MEVGVHDGVLGESLFGNAGGAVLGYLPVRDVAGRSTRARVLVLRCGEQASSAKTECPGGKTSKARPG